MRIHSCYFPSWRWDIPLNSMYNVSLLDKANVIWHVLPPPLRFPKLINWIEKNQTALDSTRFAFQQNNDGSKYGEKRVAKSIFCFFIRSMLNVWLVILRQLLGFDWEWIDYRFSPIDCSSRDRKDVDIRAPFYTLEFHENWCIGQHRTTNHTMPTMHEIIRSNGIGELSPRAFFTSKSARLFFYCS